MTNKRALITGITGQDGSYLAEHLLGLGYEVHSIVRRVALEDPARRFTRIEHLVDKLNLHPASLESYPSIFHISANMNLTGLHLAPSFVAGPFADGSHHETNNNGPHRSGFHSRSQPELSLLFCRLLRKFGSAGSAADRNDPFHRAHLASVRGRLRSTRNYGG